MNTVYQALRGTEAVTGPAEVLVHTTYPIAGWVQDMVNRPKSSVPRTTTLTEWSACLQQRSKLAVSPLSLELQQLLGPVSYQDMGTEFPAALPMPGPTVTEE